MISFDKGSMELAEFNLSRIARSYRVGSMREDLPVLFSYFVDSSKIVVGKEGL